MKILLLTEHSQNNAQLAAISAENHWKYSAHHGYDLITIRREMEEVMRDHYGRLIELLILYDAVMAIGSDVLFTNFDIPAENVLQPGDNIVVARETKGWPSKFNMGVALFCNTPATFKLLHILQETQPEWCKMRLIVQDWLNKNYELPAVKNTLRLVPTRTMNSTTDGLEGWKPGDWLIHFYGHKQDEKPKLMNDFLAMQALMVPR